MRKFLPALLIFVCVSAYSQNKFTDIQEEVNRWDSSIESASTLTNKTPKSIDFSVQHYSISGIIAKGILCEGTIVKFYETASLIPNLLLEGRVSYQTGRLVVYGIKYIKTLTGTNKIHGTFYVYNMDDFTMNYKPKKAGALRIKSSEASYLEGFYLECPVIVRMNEKNSVYVDGKTGGRSYSFLSAVIPSITLNDDDSFNIYQILLQAKDNVVMCWEHEAMFEGRVKPTINEDSTISFIPLDGQTTGKALDRKRITVSHENGNIVYTQEFNDDNQLLSKEVLYVRDDGTISERDYWNTEKIYENCYLAKWTYRNGNYFEGTIKTVITSNENTNSSNISSTATKGVFKYSNGDRFEGDLSTKAVGSFFFDGITILADGTKLEGNWLEQFQLSDSQWTKVYECQNPSDALAHAKKFMHSNYFQKFDYSGELTYFNPESDDNISYLFSNFHVIYLIYDKTKKSYSCKKGGETVFEFAVDSKGCHKWEVVYDNNQPMYINEFSWYSNGEIESLKSYNYSTKKLYLSCNFFSDGKLRSAFQYGQGNSGENIIRKSKESHPTSGRYTSNLYDLNGNYERSIEWNVGKGILAPHRLEFNKLKPLE